MVPAGGVIFANALIISHTTFGGASVLTASGL